MVVRQFRYGNDNLGYVVHGKTEALAIDGGAIGPVTRYLEENGLALTMITNTHSHSDHTVGNDALMTRDTRLITPEEAAGAGEIIVEGHSIRVIPTPGHTLDSVCFHTPGFLMAGDTLFIGKVGRCFSGRTDLLLRSIRTLMTLPGDTVLYPGHDYVEEYLGWCRTLEPKNRHLDQAMRLYDSNDVRSTLGREKLVNPFLHMDNDDVEEALKRRGLPRESIGERWNSLLGLM